MNVALILFYKLKPKFYLHKEVRSQESIFPPHPGQECTELRQWDHASSKMGNKIVSSYWKILIIEDNLKINLFTYPKWFCVLIYSSESLSHQVSWCKLCTFKGDTHDTKRFSKFSFLDFLSTNLASQLFSVNLMHSEDKCDPMCHLHSILCTPLPLSVGPFSRHSLLPLSRSPWQECQMVLPSLQILPVSFYGFLLSFSMLIHFFLLF